MKGRKGESRERGDCILRLEFQGFGTRECEGNENYGMLERMEVE